MPYFRHASPADSPAACSFSALIICSSVNLLLRMSVSRRNGLYPKSRALKGSRSYKLLGDTFDNHEAVNHTNKEYVRRDFSWHTGELSQVKITTITVEGYFSIFKRGMEGVYQHCKEKHCIAISRNLTSATTPARPLVTPI